jgi:uncharacterized protein with FMN-binding domain
MRFIGGHMSKTKPVLLLLCCILTALSIAGCRNLAAIKALEISNIPFSTVRDGQYEGYQNNVLVTAKVNVSVRAGMITDIQLLEHSHGPNHGADAIVSEVLQKQTLQVDAISGASYSSKVVLKAIELALQKGL